MGRDFTALGGKGILTYLTLAVAGYLCLDRRYRLIALILIAMVGGTLMRQL